MPTDGERLVDLDQVEVGHGQALLVERVPDRVGRLGSAASCRGRRRCRARRSRPARSARAPRPWPCSSTTTAQAPSEIGRGGAGGDRAVRAEGRPQLGQRLHCGVCRVRPRPRLTTMGSPLRCGIVTGAISSAKAPFFCAAAASWWLRAPNASCSSRLMPRLALCRSVDSPIEQPSYASVSPSRAMWSTMRHVAVLVSLPRAAQQVRRVGHRLHPAGDDDVELAGPDELVGQRDRVEPGQAHLVDRQRRAWSSGCRRRPRPGGRSSARRRPAAPGP